MTSPLVFKAIEFNPISNFKNSFDIKPQSSSYRRIPVWQITSLFYSCNIYILRVRNLRKLSQSPLNLTSFMQSKAVEINPEFKLH